MMNKNEFKKEIIEWIKSIGFALVVSFFIIAFARPTIVYGDSMNNTLNNLDLLLTNQSYYKLKDFSSGDVIVFKTPYDRNFIKRVIGVEGDRIEIKNRKVYVNGVELFETYIAEDDYTSRDMQITVPKGKVFVLGDNRNHSTDSRHIGLIDESIIIGKAYLRLFPFRKIGAIK